MKQVVQPSGGGDIAVVEAPAPQMLSTSLLVSTSATLISAGTERAATQLAQSSLVQKAKARPDLVKQVIQKARTDGLKSTISAVRSKLASDLALGYSGAGTVIEMGAATQGFAVGDRVATAGGGFASHAELQAVPWLLAARIPESVSDESASFATVASVGLHGLRLADMRIGSKVVVVGMGLIGQLTARMAVGSGCDVFGVDLDERLLALASEHGVSGEREAGAATTAAIMEWSRGRGADAVIITAGAHGDSGIIRSVPDRCRDRASVVAVGDIGLDIDRNAFYYKELDLKVARSYGPGRYDRTYEEWGVDYPVGHVRWTEGRNLEAVLDLMANGRLDVVDLITHRFEIERAADAYATLDDKNERPIGIVLNYSSPENRSTTIAINAADGKANRKRSAHPNVGIIGVGNFVRNVVVPALASSEAGPIVHVASSSGVSATRFAERHGVSRASSDAMAVIDDDDVDLVVIATPHSTHAEMVAAALGAGKDVYCEKPLALSDEELALVQGAVAASDGRLYVGFNRRYSEILVAARAALTGAGPLQIEYRVNAGRQSAEHWYSDHREGGRLLGEVCHFIDACAFLVDDADVTSVNAVAPAEAHHDSFHLLIGYSDGSSASIVYSDGSHAATPKERIEINGGGHTVVLDNFRSLTADGSKIKVTEGKGHAEGLAAFVAGGLPTAVPTAVTTTRTALAAADAISTGGP